MKKTFARTLRTLRLRYRMSQEELAEHLFVTKAAISNWETQRYMPTAYTLKRISKVLKVTIDELLLGPAEGVYYQPLTLQEQMMLRHFRWMCEERKAAVLTLIQE